MAILSVLTGFIDVPVAVLWQKVKELCSYVLAIHFDTCNYSTIPRNASDYVLLGLTLLWSRAKWKFGSSNMMCMVVVGQSIAHLGINTYREFRCSDHFIMKICSYSSFWACYELSCD